LRSPIPVGKLYNISYQTPTATWRKSGAVAVDHFCETSLGTRWTFPARSASSMSSRSNTSRSHDAENALTEFKRKNIGMMPGQGGDYYAKLAETAALLRQAHSTSRSGQPSQSAKRQLKTKSPNLRAAAAYRSTARSTAAFRR
jgi:hypothetical protein